MDIETLLQECRRANHQRGKRVTILGAGIAGLVAAYELERLGHQVDVMEGSPRIGGRVWTYRFGNDPGAPYGELGAMRIPCEHKYVLHYVQAMGLGNKLCKFVTLFEDKNALLNIHGKVFRILDAPQVIQTHYKGLFLDTRYSEKARLFAVWLKTFVDAIGSGELRASLKLDSDSNLMDEIETLHLDPFLCLQRKTLDFHQFMKAHPGFQEKCGKALSIFLNDILVETGPDLLQLEGGMDQLIHRLAAALHGPIRCNQEVVALRVCEDYVEVSWLEGGRLHTRRCDYVLCTIPFSIVRHMELSGFDEDKLATIYKTVYWPATKVIFHCARPFWQEAGIFGGASFSDEGIRQVYYPSVKCDSSKSSVLLASYTIGNDAAYLGMMTEHDRNTYVKKALSKLHPEIEAPGMILDTASIAWGNYKWSAGGCSISWESQKNWDSQNMAPLMEVIHYKKSAKPQKTLFFAGEHCSRLPAWLQGSIESALEAVYGIVAHKPFTESTTSSPLMVPEKPKA
jgi:monoamine oxidase